MTRRYLYAALALVAIAAAAPVAGASGGKISHAKLWQTATAGCGVEIHLKSKPAKNILCGAENFPAPKHNVGDPFVRISANGKPVVVYLSQDSYVATKTVTYKLKTKKKKH